LNTSNYSLGGKAWAKIQRNKALEEYYKNPSICLFCGNIIEVREKDKVHDVKNKKFCNNSCYSNYRVVNSSNQYLELRNIDENKKEVIKSCKCKKCERIFELKRIENGKFSKQKYCNDCLYVDTIGGRAKGELFVNRKNWQSARSTIQKHARMIYKQENKIIRCKVCDYDNYVEVCHIKAVSEFSNDTLISDINNINNLIGLCPNHHWEFDNGLLII
jgi:hypothetical protein